jgi:hypothetical protein
VAALRLTRRDIGPDWIGPVVDAVDTYLPVLEDAFDDETAWGPAKQVAAALTERGVDLTDRQAVDNAIHQLNAETHLNLATYQTYKPARIPAQPPIRPPSPAGTSA